MPGYDVTRSNVKSTALFVFDKYQCPKCSLLLKNAVQSPCGHWLCASCADELLESYSPKCPRPDCLEDLTATEEGAEHSKQCFPDRFVRREIEGMIVRCTNHQKGCKWEDRLAKLEDHLKACKFASKECPYCTEVLPCEQMDFSLLKHLPRAVTSDVTGVGVQHHEWPSKDQSGLVDLYGGTLPRHHLHGQLACNPEPMDFMKVESASTEGDKVIPEEETQGPAARYRPVTILPDDDQLESLAALNVGSEKKRFLEQKKATLKSLEEEVTREREKVKNALREYGDGKAMLKVSELSQKMSSTQPYISSLPFTAHGFKVCFRAYLNGDGPGKGTHMSLFLVIMKGEYDQFLPWPFDHNVTFKLINQTGERDDIVYTFQPDPMSSSFRKPKSDMNVASGCPRFVSHAELKNGGFIVDDTVFIECFVD